MIGLAAMVYEPLYHAREIETIKLSSGCSCKMKSARSSNISSLFLIKQLFHSYDKITLMIDSQLGATRLVDYLSCHIQRALVK